MTAWKDRWRAFFSIVVDPWTIVLLAATLFLGRVLLGQSDSVIVSALTLTISLSSGVLGAILISRWSALTEEKVIAARGKTAVRSLKLLLGNIVALDRRVREYLGKLTDDDHRQDISDEVVKTYLEEIVGRCGVLEEETLSSIENWTDIVPGADIKTQIGIITELKEEVGQRTQELEELTAKVEETKGQSEKEAEQLRQEIRDKERELSKARRQLADKSLVLGSTRPTFASLSGLAGPRASEGGATMAGLLGFGPPKCANCGQELPNPTLTAYIVCPNCGKNPYL